MFLKVYTQEEVDAILPDEDGVRHFPTGDYGAVKKFSEECVFGVDSIFGSLCCFGKNCKFGSHCSFGFGSIFGEGCSFGKNCKFGSHCSFGFGSVFGEGCSFGRQCAFNHWCKFDAKCEFADLCEFGGSCKFGDGCEFEHHCSFGNSCIFGKDCTFENGFKSKTDLPFITLGGAGSAARTCYFYDFEKGIHVRAGCFFGTLEEFKAAVLKDEETPETPSKKTKVYLGFCEVVELQFN